MEPKSEVEPTVPPTESVGISAPQTDGGSHVPSKPYLKQLVESIAESLPVTIVMSLFTIWALFSDDIRLAAAPKEADQGFVVVISIAFFLFLAELLAGCYYKEGYLELPNFTPVPNETFGEKCKRLINFGSFYFWLDVIATVSLIFEIPWIIGDSVDTSNQASLKSARAGRASRAGARAGRIVRLVRMVKLYKYYTSKEDELNATLDSKSGTKSSAGKPSKTKKKPKDEDSTDIMEELESESHVGAAMSDITTRRVIVLVLVMLIVIPLLSYSSIDVSPDFGAHVFHKMVKANISTPGAYTDGIYTALHSLKADLKLVHLVSNDIVYFTDNSKLNDLRSEEIDKYFYRSYAETPTGGSVLVTTSASFDSQHDTRETALFSIYLTIFILFLLVVGTYFFSADVNRLVIIPIEKMVKLVQEISKNPLGVEYKMLGEDDGFLEGMETTLLLQTITKIGSLMRVGFGEAGASVIAKNLGESKDNKLNLMGSGNLIHSIFGFCDVRNFTDTTECLQEEVMLFVNRIAHILHGIVVQCSGSANKNIGDAFLLTWKISEHLTPDEVTYLADQALLAFCKALIELTRYQDFICNFSIAATNRLFKRFPGYKVRIGSGLHVGWAIEGAIGSNMKIDASYLSPHVNMSEFLESSTKAYGVPLLMSEAFFRLLSPQASRYCRQVDRIRRSETEEPFGLFTYDSDLNLEFVEEEKADHSSKLPPMNDPRSRRKSALPGAHQIAQIPSMNSDTKVARRLPRGKSSKDIETDKSAEKSADKSQVGEKKPTVVIPKYTTSVWDTDPDVMRLRHLVNDAFRTLWKEGMAAYIKGDWQKARDIFHETMRSSNDQDGPSKFLINLLDKHGGTAPHDWQGYRED